MPFSVLIVDDSATIRGFVKLVLRPLGVTVLEAYDGGSALALMEGSPDSPASPPGLIIADVNMPGMSGLELLRAVRASERLRAVPVLLVTGDKAPELRQQALDAGAQGLVEKPLKPADLQAAVKRFQGAAA